MIELGAPIGNKFAIGNEGGSPTKYKTEYCEMLVDFFRVQPQILKKKRTYFADGQLKSEEEYPIASELPTFQSFADKIGVHVDTLHEWKNKHEEFSEAYARAKQLQEHIWLVNSMGNLYNAQFAQFFGKNCLGYKDKTEVESTNTNYDVGSDQMEKFFANATEEEIANFESMNFAQIKAIINRK